MLSASWLPVMVGAWPTSASTWATSAFDAGLVLLVGQAVERQPPHLAGDRGHRAAPVLVAQRGGDAGGFGGVVRSRSRATSAEMNGGLAPLASTESRLSSVVLPERRLEVAGARDDALLSGRVLVLGAADLQRRRGVVLAVSISAAVGRFMSTWPRSGFFGAGVSFFQAPNAAMIRAFSSSRGRSPTATTIEFSGRYQRWWKLRMVSAFTDLDDLLQADRRALGAEQVRQHEVQALPRRGRRARCGCRRTPT